MNWLHPIRSWRRRRISKQPFPEVWEEILSRNFPLAKHLPASDQQELRRRIQFFVDEKNFEGAGGLEMTDEIRVTVAAQACLLLLRRGDDIYPRLSSIIVYPTAYKATTKQRNEFGAITESEQVRLGEAWNVGAVVLSWDDVRYGAGDVRDGKNVTLHEFAHQLDMEDNAGDGAPELPRRSMYVAWARVLGAEYEKLQKKAHKGKRSVMDKYGATNPAEFFAVATETFFEKPTKLREKHPELYEQLQEFYEQDPAEWGAADPTE